MSASAYIDPSPEQLRDIAISADMLLLLDAAEKYGLVRGAPGVNVERCEEIIEQAHEAGHDWTQDEVLEAFHAMFTGARS